MAKFKELLATAWSAISDPNQQNRIETIVSAIEHAFKQFREKFDLATVLGQVDHRPSDVEAAKCAYYKKLLRRYWADGVPNDSGKRVLSLVAQKLELAPQQVLTLNQEIGVTYLGAKVASFLEDGVLTDVEMSELASIGSYLRVDIRSLLRHKSSDEVLGILRSVFADATFTGRLQPSIWNNLKSSATKLGFNEEELIAATSQLARSYAEHVLADIKSDGIITEQESQYLSWLVQTFRFETAFVNYLHDQIAYLKQRERILAGHLVPVPIPHGANLKSGEILYFSNQAIYRQTKTRQGAASFLDHAGHLLMTDNRIVFHSPTKPISIQYRSILNWHATSQHLQISVANKPEIHIFIPPSADRLFAEKVTALIKLHNQTLVKKADGTVDRHIPRDVRQRVWQRYGGRCAECGATDYLEFDHIVPVNKGGSNSDNNVQLLCRGCNLKKSDNI